MKLEEILAKIIGLINKPFHYLFVGLVVLYLSSKENKIYGWILLALAFGSFIDWLIKLVKNKYRQIEHNNRIKTESLEHKKLIIDKYNKLNDKEKEIIDTCINTNNLRVEKEGSYEALKTLEIKGFGKGLNDTFTMHEKVFEILSEIKNMEALS